MGFQPMRIGRMPMPLGDEGLDYRSWASKPIRLFPSGQRVFHRLFAPDSRSHCQGAPTGTSRGILERRSDHRDLVSSSAFLSVGILKALNAPLARTRPRWPR